MARQPKGLTPEQIIEGFQLLKLEDQLKTFETLKKIMSSIKQEAADKLNKLVEADID